MQFENGLRERYFNWLYGEAIGTDPKYRQLLYFLHNIDFRYSLSMDENRFKDGMSMRYQFGWIYKYSTNEIAEYVDICPCSVLEMMLALCRRMEKEYMGNAREGDRTSVWFKSMLDCMFLNNYTDMSWCSAIAELVRHRVDIMLDRRYLENGEGGLFACYQNNVDMTKIDYWNQMVKKCNELLRYS